MAYLTACTDDVKVDQHDEDDDPVLFGKTSVRCENRTNGSGVAFGNTPLQSKHIVKVRISRYIGIHQQLHMLVLPVSAVDVNLRLTVSYLHFCGYHGLVLRSQCCSAVLRQCQPTTGVGTCLRIMMRCVPQGRQHHCLV